MNKPAPAPVPALIEQHTVSDKKTKTIPLAGLVTKGMQLRVTTDKEAVARYAEAYANGEELPPIVVFDDGWDALLVADGHHRVAASEKAGKKSIECIIKKGDRRAARLYASRANLQHGVPLTNDDKRNIVRDLLGDAEWRKWSDRELARHTGTSPNFVGKIRKQLPKDQQSSVRKGKDGTERDTKNIGKVQAIPDVVKVCDYLRGSIADHKPGKTEIELTILPPPARCPGHAIILDMLIAKGGGCQVGHTIERYKVASKSGENRSPKGQRDGAWPHAIRHHLMDAVLPVLEHDKAHRKVRLYVVELAQALEHLERQKPVKGDTAPAPSTDEQSQRLAAAKKLGDLIRAGGVVDAVAACDRILLAMFAAGEYKTIEGIAEAAKLSSDYVADDLVDLRDRGLVVPVTRKDKKQGHTLTDAGNRAALKLLSDEPEELTLEGGSAGEVLPPHRVTDPEGEGMTAAEVADYMAKDTPSIAADTPAAKRLTFARELLGMRLLKEKHQWCGKDQELVSLALVVGVPMRADDEPWSNDLVTRAWRVLTDRVQEEVAERLHRGETTKLPPIELLAKWWGIDHAALVMQAERSVEG